MSNWLETCAVAINDTLINSKDIELKTEIEYLYYLLFVEDENAK